MKKKYFNRIILFALTLSLLTGLINIFILKNLENTISDYIEKINNNGFEIIPHTISKEGDNVSINSYINLFLVSLSFGIILLYLLFCFNQCKEINNNENPREYRRLLP